MELDEYQKDAMKTAVYRKNVFEKFKGTSPEAVNMLLKSYVTNGLASEAGEVAGVFKKMLRGDPIKEHDILQELGGVLWYIAACAYEFGYSLQEVADFNLAELAQRANEGSIANKNMRSFGKEDKVFTIKVEPEYDSTLDVSDVGY